MNRRKAVKTLGLAGLATAITPFSGRTQEAPSEMPPLSGRIRHSVSRWCFSDIPLEQFCVEAKRIGLEAIDLLNREEWPVVLKHGLECSMVLDQPKGFGIPKGFNRFEHHDTLVAFYEDLIPRAAKDGIKQVICFPGNRRGLDDELGIQICATGLKRLMPLAEKHQVILSMELLNSKVDHADYQCDHTAWGVELVKSVGSDSFKLLYDIYHMQIMEGDVIRNIRDNHTYISHYHTAGVPGRHEIDDTQELYYPAIMKAIADTGYKGFVAQEFIPVAKDKIGSLEKCVRICDI